MRYICLPILVFFTLPIFAQPIEPENYKKYSGACLKSKLFYQPGTFTFNVKASNITGTIFCAFLTDFEVNNSDDFLKHIELGFELVGQSINSIKCVAVLNGRKYHIQDFPLGFDASEDFHKYQITQSKDAIKWLVDGKLVWSLAPDIAVRLLKPMRLFINFRPAVSHCDIADGWGCIRKAILPAYAFINQFTYHKAKEISKPKNFTFMLCKQKNIHDNFNTLNSTLWEISLSDLIKGNKPLYKPDNLFFDNFVLKLQINRQL